MSGLNEIMDEFLQPKVKQAAFDMAKMLFANPSKQDEFGEIGIDIVKETDSYILYADLPGVKKADIDILINKEGGLVLSVTRKPTEGTLFYQTRRFGEFKEVVDLPKDIDTQSKITASLVDGVLVVVIKRVQEPVQRIKID